MSNKYIEQLVKMAEEDGIGSSVVKGLATGASIGAGAVGAAALGKKGKAFLRTRKIAKAKAGRAVSAQTAINTGAMSPA